MCDTRQVHRIQANTNSIYQLVLISHIHTMVCLAEDVSLCCAHISQTQCARGSYTYKKQTQYTDIHAQRRPYICENDL